LAIVVRRPGKTKRVPGLRNVHNDLVVLLYHNLLPLYAPAKSERISSGILELVSVQDQDGVRF